MRDFLENAVTAAVRTLDITETGHGDGPGFKR